MLLMLLFVFFPSCTQKGTRVNINILKHRIIREQIDDLPIKTQVVQHVFIDDQDYTESQIELLLEHLFDEVSGRDGFQYHDRASNIYIYAYTTEEKAKSEAAQWVGMISMSPGQSAPLLNINKHQLNSLHEEPTEKWNKPLDVRKEIWAASIKARRNAQCQADELYPYWELDNPKDFLEKNIDSYRELEAKYDSSLASRYQIRTEILDSISLEGILNGWTYPERTN